MSVVTAGTASASLAAGVLVWSVIVRQVVDHDARVRAGGLPVIGRIPWWRIPPSDWMAQIRLEQARLEQTHLGKTRPGRALVVWIAAGAQRLGMGRLGLTQRDPAVQGAAVVGPVGPAGGDATADMVQVLDAVARLIRGGAGVHQALRSVVPVAGVHAADLAGVVGQLDGGVTLVDALAGWRQRQPTAVVSLTTAVLTFGVDTGGSLARAVDGAAATLRERVALRGEVQVLAAQARASALVVGAAPVGFMVLVAIADPRVASFLVSTVAGWLCLVVGAGLEIGCVVWMRSLVARAGVL
jgi:tight adherence protein B